MQPNEMTVFGITFPTVVAAALMGSALTLLGVFLQNLFENWRTNKKLKHEAEEKKNERLQNAKRQIYLEAAVEVAKAAKYLHKTFHLRLPPEELESLLAGYDAAIAKVHLVGGFQTIKALDAANDTFQSQVLQLHKIRAPYLQKIELVKAVQIRMGEDLQTQQNLINRFEQVQRLNSTDPELGVLTEKFNATRIRIEQSQELRTKLEQDINEGVLVVFEKALNAARDYSAKLRLVNVAAREELALSFHDNGTEYLNFLEASAERHAKRISEFFSKPKQESPTSKPVE